MLDISSSERFARAAVFACEQHRGQNRDDARTPYAVHVFRVAEHLRRIAAEQDEEVLLAALLHDTIEDTGITYDTIASQFGGGVAELVAELTNDNRLPKAQRRAAMIEHIYTISTRAKRIKLADRLDNVTELVRGDSGTKEKLARYVQETEHILQACKGACPPLEHALAEAFTELKQRL